MSSLSHKGKRELIVKFTASRNAYHYPMMSYSPSFPGSCINSPRIAQGRFQTRPIWLKCTLSSGWKGSVLGHLLYNELGEADISPRHLEELIYLFRRGDDANVWKIEYESCEHENIWVLGPSKCQFHTVQSHVYQEGSLMIQVSGPDIQNPSQRFFIFSGSQTFLRRHSFQGKIHSHLLKCCKCYGGRLLRPPGDPWGLADNISFQGCKIIFGLTERWYRKGSWCQTSRTKWKFET